MNGGRPTSDRIMRLITGYWATGIPGAAATHSLFTHLEDGATTAGRPAARAGISHQGAQALLDGLVSIGLVEVHDGRYRNTAEASTFLVEGVRSALKPGGTLVVSDYMVDDDRGGPPYPLTFAAEVLLKSRYGTTWRRATTTPGSPGPASRRSRSSPRHRRPQWSSPGSRP
jgi:hypothetical protein